MSDVIRPLPQPTDLTRPYWQAAARGELHMQHCQACNRWQFYPRPFCVHCESDDVQWRAVSGLGRIYTYTVNHRAPNPFMKQRLPYVVALVELDEGPRLMANIQGDGALETAIGRRVKVIFEAISEELALPQFTLME